MGTAARLSRPRAKTADPRSRDRRPRQDVAAIHANNPINGAPAAGAIQSGASCPRKPNASNSNIVPVTAMPTAMSSPASCRVRSRAVETTTGTISRPSARPTTPCQKYPEAVARNAAASAEKKSPIIQTNAAKKAVSGAILRAAMWTKSLKQHTIVIPHPDSDLYRTVTKGFQGEGRRRCLRRGSVNVPRTLSVRHPLGAGEPPHVLQPGFTRRLNGLRLLANEDEPELARHALTSGIRPIAVDLHQANLGE